MISRLRTLDPAGIGPLLTASRREGFRFVGRLCREWQDGSNRFQKPGEALFGLFRGGKLLGIGGINRQDHSTGRLRRFYILPSCRRRGLGSRLLRHILAHAARYFRRVVLRTTTKTADRFYVARGFTRLHDSDDASHAIELAKAVRGRSAQKRVRPRAGIHTSAQPGFHAKTQRGEER